MGIANECQDNPYPEHKMLMPKRDLCPVRFWHIGAKLQLA